jgi:7,8-didemethyl-8-hydroxy-5-deazariboflavin synthase CofG subunit
VLDRTGLLPHVNAGLLARKDIESLRPFSPSMGLMLENISDRMSCPGMPHENAIDKQPAARIKTIEEAGRHHVPFTTGILIGIGETLDERIDSLFAIRELHERYGHIQEVIIQNFRAKPEIPMRDHPEPGIDDLKITAAVARLILWDINVQAPPNLSDENYPDLLGAGINDWGGISPLTKDFINPEKPWPQIEALKTRTEAAGLILKERLSVYPEYVFKDEFVDASAASSVRRLADQSGYATDIALPLHLAAEIGGQQKPNTEVLYERSTR